VTKGKPSLRLFVGIYPPEAAAVSMLALLEGVALPEHRTTPVEQLHLTVHFIGDTPVGDLDRVTESVERSASGLGAFELTPERVIALPRRGPPRLVALETDAPPALLELKRRLAKRLASNVRKEPAGRFLPHFTLCRFGRGARVDRLDMAVEMAPFAINRVRLMRSVLRPEGAEHREVAAFDLQ
jgi:2'-5' RNA ligase